MLSPPEGASCGPGEGEGRRFLSWLPEEQSWLPGLEAAPSWVQGGPVAWSLCSGLFDLPPSFLLCSEGVRFPWRGCQEAWGLCLLTSGPAPASVSRSQVRGPGLLSLPSSRGHGARGDAKHRIVTCHLAVSSQPWEGVWACSGGYYQDPERRRAVPGPHILPVGLGGRAGGGPWEGGRNQGPVWAG